MDYIMEEAYKIKISTVELESLDLLPQRKMTAPKFRVTNTNFKQN